MATVRSLVSDALIEINVLSQGETMAAPMAQNALRIFQRQIDAWAADRLTLAVQSRTSITWPSSTSTQTIGPSGADITAQRPVFINQLNYVVPGTSPEVETIMGAMNDDSYAVLSIKALQSGLPTLFYYQTSLSTILGTIFVWPQPTQELTLYLYAQQAVTVPVTLDDILLGPPGYQEAFLYQLAIRLIQPFGRDPSKCQATYALAEAAYARMKRPNNQPGLLGVDAALIPNIGGGYNILNDSFTAPSN